MGAIASLKLVYLSLDLSQARARVYTHTYQITHTYTREETLSLGYPNATFQTLKMTLMHIVSSLRATPS